MPVIEERHATVRMPSGRIVRAEVVEPGAEDVGGQSLYRFQGLAPFRAVALTHQQVIDIERGLA